MGVDSCFVDYRLILLLVVFDILFLHVFFLLRKLEAYERIEKYSNKYEERLLQPPPCGPWTAPRASERNAGKSNCHVFDVG